MLSCGKIIGQLPKISRHYVGSLKNYSPKYDGFVSIGSLKFSSSSSKKPPNPKTPPLEEKKPSLSGIKKGAPCDQAGYNCPPACEEVCNPNVAGADSSKNTGDDGWKKFWKPIFAVVLLTGVTIFAVRSTSQLGTQSENNADATKKVKRKSSGPKKITKVPANSSTIPSEIPYLLIGGGTAAFSAFKSIKTNDTKAKVLIVTEEEDLPYMRTPLSKDLWYNKDKDPNAPLVYRQWSGAKRSLFYEPAEFYTKLTDLPTSEKGGVSIVTGWKVKKLDVINKVATLDDDHTIKYEKCLIATGSRPKSLQIFDAASEQVKEKISTFRTAEDYLMLESKVKSPDVKNIVIVGGGFLGTELACALSSYLSKDKKKVHQIFREKSVMAQVLPEYLSEWTMQKVNAEGVNCIPNSEVVDYIYKDGKLTLVLTGDKTVEADHVILAVGATPNTDLAEESKLEVNSNIGGFLVNAELEARSNLWVAGDAACFYDVRLGRRRVEHHDHAVVSGKLAGENMTGAGKPYHHQSMFWSDLGPEIGYEGIGIVDSSLPTVAAFAKASKNEDESSTTETSQKQSPYDKGVVFYLRDDVIVGIVLWNLLNRMSIARQVLAKGSKYDDLNEVAKLFKIHES